MVALFYLQDTPLIEVIDFAANRIKTIPEAAFAGLDKLRSLRLLKGQSNKIFDLHVLS